MKKYFVIGNPIKHSLSPKLHNYWIKKNNISAVYEKKELQKEEIENFILEVRKKSKAWAAGLRKNDIISSVNRMDVRNVEQFLDAFNNSKERVLLRVIRDGGSALVMVQ